MSTIEQTLASLKASNTKALIPYLVVGYPTPQIFLSICEALSRLGIHLVEFGLPFSDPLADGPTIQAATSAVLAQGTTGEALLTLLEEGSRSAGIPAIAMGYINTFQALRHRGLLQLYERGLLHGAIIPDLPPEESAEWEATLASFQTGLTHLVAPTTSPRRLPHIVVRSSGYVYVVALTGVTGARPDHVIEIRAIVSAIRNVRDIPVMVGFGISNAMQAEHAARQADGSIVGSALIQRIAHAYASDDNPVDVACDFLADLNRGVQRAATD